MQGDLFRPASLLLTPMQIDFLVSHKRHPQVYVELVRLCRTYRRQRPGRPWAIDAAYQVLRWERVLAGLPEEDEDFKLNNNYRSRYARLIMDQEPDLADIFETRTLTA